jgi:hypothetical protein
MGPQQDWMNRQAVYSPQAYFDALQQQYAAQQQMQQAPVQPQKKKRGLLATLVPAAGAIGAGLLAAPLTGGLSLAGTIAALGAAGAAGGALGEAGAQKLAGEKFNLGNIGKEALISGAFGAGGAAISGARGLRAAKAVGMTADDAARVAAEAARGTTSVKAIKQLGGPSGVSGKIAEAGTGLRAGVVNPKIAASPFGAEQEAKLVKTLGELNIKGSATAQYRQLPGKINQLGGQIENVLAKNTNTSTMPSLVSTIKSKAKDLPQFVGADPNYAKTLSTEISDITARFGGKQLTAAQVQSAKTELGSKMSGIFTKVAKGADLNPKEASRLAVWQSLDDTIGKLAPEAKRLTAQQSALYTASPGLLTASKKTAGIPLLGIKTKTAERAAQAVQDVAGRGLQTIGGATGAVPTGLAGTISRQAGRQLVPRAAMGLSGGGAAPEAPLQGDMGMQPVDLGAGITPGMPQDMGMQQPQELYSQQAVMSDIQRDPKNAATYLKLYETFATKQPAPIKKSEAQRSRDEAAQLTQTALQQLQAGSINTGLVSGKIEPLKAMLGKGDPETLAFNTTISSLKAAIAKARAGTSFTPNEERLLNKYAPTVGDSRQQLFTKLQALQAVYDQAAAREYGTQYSDNTDLQSALMQAQGGF